MKKILFLLGITLSVCGFASTDFSISINDIESQYAINPFAFKTTDNVFYVLKVKPASFLGISTRNLDITGIMISFEDITGLGSASLIFDNKKDVNIFLDRLKRKFNIKDTYDNRYESEDNCPQCFGVENNTFCIQNRPAINKISVTLIKH